MSTCNHLLVVDARETTRARQPDRVDLHEVVVTITQRATGRRQAVRVAVRKHRERARRRQERASGD